MLLAAVIACLGSFSVATAANYAANSADSVSYTHLPKELDPRLEPPLAPPSGIVRPLTAEETARRERELAPVPTAGLKEAGEKAIEAYNVKEKTVDGQIQEFLSLIHI